MKRSILCAFALSTSIPVFGEILLPEGKGLPVAREFSAPYLKAETEVWFTYLRPGMSELESIMRWKQNLPPNRYEFDSKTKMLRSHEVATITRSDSAGLAVRVLMRGDYDAGAKIFTLVARGFDDSARRVAEYLFDAAQPSAPIDSTHWVWRHPGCADEVRQDGRWVWTVDSSGHCLEGAYQVPDTSHPGAWIEEHRLRLSWKGTRLVQASEWVANQQVSREDFVYANDRIESIRGYTVLEDGGSYLSEKTTFTYFGDELEERTMEAYDVDGTRYAYSNLKPTVTKAASVAPAAGQAGLRMRTEPGVLVAENNSTESVSVRFCDASGNLLGEVAVEPGSQGRWATRSSKVVFWNARGGRIQASGKAITSR
ncbi:MAG: hypothetical protein IPK50_22840 [Fibrobacterota bacterium]|nr:hypothetical protein [Fibrobacterota bacterium]QQS05080.1 MAG: hypothetical protein IPK50_22840 [Fibrobacterota bacterium]